MFSLANFLVENAPITLPKHLYTYVPGQTPLSTTPAVVTALVSYLAIIFGIQAYMTDKPPRKLNTLFQIHNVFLSGGSLLLLVLMLEEIVPIAWKHGVFYAICHPGAWTNASCHFIHLVSYSCCHRKWSSTIS
jgi:fatty acid elongase 3